MPSVGYSSTIRVQVTPQNRRVVVQGKGFTPNDTLATGFRAAESVGEKRENSDACPKSTFDTQVFRLTQI